MVARLLLLFVLFPLAELAILIRVGTWLGFWPTMGIVIGTGAVGVVLARSQGARVLGRIRADLAGGRAPGDSLVDGFLVLVGGIVLLTPGLITDVIGLLLLLPVTRDRLKGAVRARFERMVETRQVSFIAMIR